jgi:hypothetical protein
MNDSPVAPAPSSTSLLKATGIAVVVAALVLVLFVLPAEYGVDPTGIGARLGLTAIREADDQELDAATLAAVSEPTDAAPISVLDALWKSAAPFRSDEMSLTLAPEQGAEIKALMKAGDRMMFTWNAAGGGVNFDMHGEALNAAKDEFTSYLKGRDETTGHGSFQAPFAGTHGWYWRNRGAAPVTIRVKTAGYYEKLFKP